MLSERQLSNLVELDLSDNQISCTIASITFDNWPHLKHLNLAHNTLGIPGLAAITRATWPSLETLVLRNNHMNNQSVQQLIQGQWPLLRVLILSENIIGSKGVDHLVKSNWPQLKLLDLSCNQIGNMGLGFLVNQKWPMLAHLNIADNDITHRGLLPAFGKMTWPRLKTLILDNNELEMLPMLEQFKTLSTLSLNNTMINNDALETLARMSIGRLKRVQFATNQIDARGLVPFVYAYAGQLSDIDLSENNLGEYGVQVIGNIQWPSLVSLNLMACKLGPNALKSLESLLGQFPSLTQLNVSLNFFDASHLARVLKNCNVMY